MIPDRKKNRNKWFVVTGGPCSGKTTTLRHLATRGYRVEYEVARIYIDEEMAKGRKLSDIRHDEVKFQAEVLRRKVQLERRLPVSETIFLERGIHDTAAYYALCGAPMDQGLLSEMAGSRYGSVFILEMLQYKKDYARTEDRKTAQKIQQLIKTWYATYGLQTISVPVLPVGERVKFILTHLQK